jgi:hypothetical protein
MLIINIFFTRQGLSGPYQMSESDMDLIILVEQKKNTNNFCIDNFTILAQLRDFVVVF